MASCGADGRTEQLRRVLRFNGQLNWQLNKFFFRWLFIGHNDRR
jgi:hypothetical protein